MEAFLEAFHHLRHFNLEEIKPITNNFDNKKVIGEGGFGKVYKGVLSDSKGQTMVAFKRLDSNCGQGNPEFFKEILMLSRYIHENLISLLGFCDGDGEKILAYEYASHESLDRHLSSMTLTWTQRLKICLGAARGLFYLHDPKETRERVIHRDIKSSNILLDENWNAKVSDMGLSKIGPANRLQSFLATNVVVLCGSLCYETKTNHPQSLVRWWKKCYKEKKMEEIIFHHLKQDMDLRSLETFSEIAYQCLQKSRSERPKMSYIVEKLEVALGFQHEISKKEKLFQEGVSKFVEFKEMVNTVVNKEELEMLLSEGIIINEGKTWFSLNKNGEHIEMISAECFEHTAAFNWDYDPYGRETKSRFEGRKRRGSYGAFKTHVRTQLLSPYITYRFISNTENVDLQVKFYCVTAIEAEGIEFQPLERVEDEKEDMDMQTISHPDTYWEQILPNDWKEILKLSKYHSLRLKTKKELYSILCKGFAINNDKEWFFLAKNGKKCHMPSAELFLRYADKHLESRSLPNLRLSETTFDHVDLFWIECRSNMLSPETTYAAYLVYKLQENHSRFEPPVKVYMPLTSGVTDPWYIYLLSHQAPLIRDRVYQKKRLPQQRSDGCMEVQVYEFQTDTTTTARITIHFESMLSDNRSFKGLTVQGMEFKPI
ncbi:unnamed protein product [Lactuca saligna]|uniref:non-specific serine/threonine protein kinase n=1 Tax=Lactuca saligna TaxID=75948 RepID=A0AA35Z439_LACSI|nr:unnamed protein product [Lactuca saligna]